MSLAARLLGRSRPRLPLVLQNEMAECGLACLAMIAGHHGHRIDLAGLRRRFPTSAKGANLAHLIRVAAELDLDARALRAEIPALPALPTPFIAHWDLNHFVVVERIDAKRVRLHDPASGVVEMTLERFGRHFTGVALELRPAAGFAPVREIRRISLAQLAGRVSGLRRAALQVLLLALALETITLALPLAMQWTLDQVLVSGDVDLLFLIGTAFLGLVLVQALLAVARGWLLAEIGASLSLQWMANLFGRLLRLPLAYFERRSVAGVLSRFASVQAIQQTLTGSFVEAVLDGLTVVLVLALMLFYSPALTALVLAAFAVYAGARWLAYRRLRTLKEEQLVYQARQQGQLLESLHGIQAIKLANKQAQRRAGLENAGVDAATREIGVNRIAIGFAGLSRLLAGSQRIAVLWLAAWMTLSGTFSAGMLVVFVGYADLFATRAGSLIDKLTEFRLLGLHASRIADIALEEPEASGAGDLDPGVLDGPIRVENVSFRYSDQDPWILRHCSLTIQPGESLAITGPSGGGKTTLAKLILGLLQPTEGRICIGEVEIGRIGLGAYRERFGAVMQDDALFSGSIAANIAFFDDDAGPGQVEAAAQAAQLLGDIQAMPMGFETLIGEMGGTLSGGQKQRLLLARALYRRPSYLLLDEATSHLDVTREALISSAIAQMRITRILIAHRPETIRTADRAVALVGGRIHRLDEDGQVVRLPPDAQADQAASRA